MGFVVSIELLGNWVGCDFLEGEEILVFGVGWRNEGFFIDCFEVVI